MVPTQTLDAQRNTKMMVVFIFRVTYDQVSKFLPDLSATDKGHIIQTRQGAQSIRIMRQAVVDARENVDDMDPAEQVCPALDDQTFCYAVLVD